MYLNAIRVKLFQIKVPKSVKYFVILSFILFMASNYYKISLIKRYIFKKEKLTSMKYILQWTSPFTGLFVYMGKGQEVFFQYGCPEKQCFITGDKGMFINETYFDAIIFHVPELKNIILPKYRCQGQVYVFASIESSHNYPVPEPFNNYFNWTFTYKLNSDLYFGYIIVRNIEGQVIGPKEEMQWLKPNEMQPISKKLVKELSTKRVAACWFVSHCKTRGKREDYVKELANELIHYNMSVHIYGNCGTPCSRNSSQCLHMLRHLYYFYLSFENSFAEDYVTEKLLTAVQNNAVPVVYGKANYTRFLPDGAYLEAIKMAPKDLGKIMVEAINNKTKYYDFFRWKNHYTYHKVEDSPETNPYCKLCEKLHNKSERNKNNQYESKFYKNIATWWNK